MEAALSHFDIDVTGLTCLDAGLSTGGFTDCLLQNGAAKVYGVDVGFGQVSSFCRQPVTVTVMGRVYMHSGCRKYHSHGQGLRAKNLQHINRNAHDCS